MAKPRAFSTPRLSGLVLHAVFLASVAPGCGSLEAPEGAKTDAPRRLVPAASGQEREAAGPGPEEPDLGRELAGKPLSLEKALELAERFNPAFAALEREIAAARGRQVQAGLYPNPVVDAGAEEWPTGDGLGEANLIAGISQPIVLGARLRAAEAAAGKAREAAEADHAQARRALRADVRAAFAVALFWRDRAALAREILVISRESVAVAEARVKAGDAPESELLRAEIERERTSLELSQAENELLGARRRLASFLGDPAAPVGELAGTLGGPAAAFVLEDLQKRVIESYPGIAAATRRFEQARFELSLARAEVVPDIEVRVGAGRLGESGDTALEVGFAIPLPLFDRNQGRIAEAEAGIGRAAREAEARANEILLELAEDVRVYDLAREQVKRYDEAILPRARRSLDQTQAGYRAGALSFPDVLDSQRTLGETRALYVDALRDLAVARAELEKFLGN